MKKLIILIAVFSALFGFGLAFTLVGCGVLTNSLDNNSYNSIIETTSDTINEINSVAMDYVSTSSGKVVYQDKEVLEEVRNIIDKIKIPQYYSEYNGEALPTTINDIEIRIVNYDYETGEAQLQAQASLIGSRGTIFRIRLEYQKEESIIDITDEVQIFYCPTETFTIGELESNLDWFYWTKDYQRYYQWIPVDDALDIVTLYP